jgi:hypothetical protein
MIVAGLFSGVFTVLAGAYLPKKAKPEPGLLALGAVAPSVFLSMPDAGLKTACMAFVVGLGFAALTLGEDVAATTAIGGAIVALATIMGRYGSSASSYTHAGVALACGVSLLGLMATVIERAWPNASKFMPVAVRVLALGLAYALGNRYLGLSSAWLSMALAVAAGVAVYAILPSDEAGEPGRSVLAAVLWVALGTLAFGLARGYGMSLALILAAGLPLVLGEKRALTSTGPLVGLVLYRVFREAHVEASRALDLGQHYALIGLLLGALLPLLPERWWATKPSQPSLQSLGGFLWTLVWMAFPPVVAILLGAKGVVGFVAGLGMCAVFSGTLAESTQLPLAVAAGAGGLAILTYGWLDTLSSLSRDDKVQWVLKGAVPLAVAVSLIALIGYRKPSVSQPQAELR